MNLDWTLMLQGGGLVAVLALLLSFIARPTQQTIADLRADVDEMRDSHIKEITELKREHHCNMDNLRAEIASARRDINGLRESNYHLRVVFTALSLQYNLVRQQMLESDPNLKILTIQEIIAESHVPLQQVTTPL